MSNNYFDVIIVGAGCSGLHAAKYMTDLKIKILEKNDYLGGRVESRTLDGFNIETGALFPILEGSDRRDVSANNTKNIKYIKENGQELTAKTVVEILEIEDDDGLLENYTKQTRVLNEQLGLKAKNINYGNISVLNNQQRKIVEAVYQITHCGDINDCLKDIGPLTLHNISQPDLSKSNKDRLEQFFSMILDDIELESNVNRIESSASYCKVSSTNNGVTTIYESQYVLVSSPPPEIFDCIKGVNIESADFYSNIKYEAGSVCVLKIQGNLPQQELLINTHKIWSACFISSVEEGGFILHVYIPHCRGLINNYIRLTINDVYESVKDFLPSESRLKDGVIKHWNYLSPSLNPEMMKRYFPGHYRLTPRIWYCGELASFEPKNIYTFGTRSALNSGKSIALALKQEIKKNNGIRLNGLFNSEIYKITRDQPVYIRSRVDGNIAYYGVIASAYRENSVIDYLYNYQKDNQWEFHENYGPTLEDSLIVIEGLIEAVGVPKVRELFKIEKYINNYQMVENGLFTTIKNGCSNYWNGPSIVGNAHILYIMEKLNITDRLIDKKIIVDYLLSRRRSNGLWESKWFTNRFYTTFYVIRALLIEDNTKIGLNIEEMISTLVQSMKTYGGSENSLISMIYIIRTLSLLIKKSRQSNKNDICYSSTIKVCYTYMNEVKRYNPNCSSESLLYYWQDIASNQGDNKIFITSKPKTRLLDAMICITENDLADIDL